MTEVARVTWTKRYGNAQKEGIKKQGMEKRARERDKEQDRLEYDEVLAEKKKADEEPEEPDMCRGGQKRKLENEIGRQDRQRKQRKTEESEVDVGH